MAPSQESLLGPKRMLLQAKILGVYYYWLFLFDANWERGHVLKAVYLSLVNFEFMLLALPLLTDNEFLFIPKCRVWNGRSIHVLSPESSLRDESLSDMELSLKRRWCTGNTTLNHIRQVGMSFVNSHPTLRNNCYKTFMVRDVVPDHLSHQVSVGSRHLHVPSKWTNI